MNNIQIANEADGFADSKNWNRWFNRVSGRFLSLLNPFAGKPIVYVEIGTWAGASASAVCRKILTHPKSRGFGIDPYPPDRRRHDVPLIKKTAAERCARIGDRWTWIYEDSHSGLLSLRKLTDSIDVLYIDGNHDAHAVVMDFALAWPLLKPGSLVIFDDYWTHRTSSRKRPVVDSGYAAIMQAWRLLVKEDKGAHRRQRAIRILSKEHAIK